MWEKRGGMINNDLQSTTQKKPKDRTPIKTDAPEDKQFLLHTWHPWCYSC